MKRALVEPFEKKHGVKVEVVTGITTEWVAKILASGPDNPPFDVVFGNEPPFPIPRERGFFEKRNDTLAPNIKHLYPKALIGDTSLAMAYAGRRATYVIGNTLGINFMASKLYGKDYFDIDTGAARQLAADPRPGRRGNRAVGRRYRRGKSQLAPGGSSGTVWL